MQKIPLRFPKTAKELTIAGMLAALVIVGTMIKIPYGNGAMVHLGSAALFTASLLFGGMYGALAGAIGSAFYDLLMGMSPYTIFSFFIKGAAGLTVGMVAYFGAPNTRIPLWRGVLACASGAAVTLVGYMFAWSVVIGSWQAALTNLPSSLISSAVGTCVALPLYYALSTALKKGGIT